MELKLNALSEGQSLLSDSDIQLLSTWVALIVLTLQEIGVRAVSANG